MWNICGAHRQTPSLAGRLADSAPYNWEGSQPTLEGNIRQTIARLGGKGAQPPMVSALAAYLLDGLAPPSHPHRDVAPAQAAMVARGREIFDSPEVGCSTCHAGGARTDGENYDVGTIGSGERKSMRRFNPHVAMPELNTPSLRDLALTPPYLHDGSAPNLDAVLRDTDGRMGSTGQLTPDDRAALIAYLETL